MDVFFDFDDTLVETRVRDHAAYAESLPAHVCPLSFDEFKTLRCKCMSINDILVACHKITGQDVIDTIMRRQRLLEQPNLLRLDSMFPGVQSTLSELVCMGVTLHIVSARLSVRCLRDQCADLELTTFVPRERITATGNPATKAAAVKLLHRDKALIGAFVGDTEHDVRAGLTLGLKAVGVTTGLTSRKRLERAGAHHVIDDISCLVRTICP